MQGKFQLQILPKSGHAVHEDTVEEVATCLANFLIRNHPERLPPRHHLCEISNHPFRTPTISPSACCEGRLQCSRDFRHLRQLAQAFCLPQTTTRPPIHFQLLLRTSFPPPSPLRSARSPLPAPLSLNPPSATL
nr:unnamed protein product [Spirometra erinaceieuropaei]